MSTSPYASHRAAMFADQGTPVTPMTLMDRGAVFFKSVYEEMFVNTKEVRMELKSKEDVEEFRRKLDEQLKDYIKEIAEEEEIKDKDE